VAFLSISPWIDVTEPVLILPWTLWLRSGMNHQALLPGAQFMATFKLVGAAAISLCMIASPTMAKDRASSTRNAVPTVPDATPNVSRPVESIYCATRDAGNPHSKICDYMAWSKWRELGQWDGQLDDACIHDPSHVPQECGLDPKARKPFSFF
jgi:hypothetical protein